VQCAAVPETTIHEDGYPLCGKYDIGDTSGCLSWRGVNAIPKAQRVERLTKHQFRLRILLLVRLHSSPCRRRGSPGAGLHSP
jgi:hypothetical protein